MLVKPRSSEQPANLVENRVSELVKYVGIPVAQLEQRHHALECWCRGILLNEQEKTSEPNQPRGAKRTDDSVANEAGEQWSHY